MAKFRELGNTRPQEIEAELRQRWEDNGLLEKLMANREGAKPFVFFEGPPTANGKPGVHHVMARTLKDSVCRYKTMMGYQVKRKAGWDTHGLPVEIEVEKKLGLKDKRGIEEYGIKEFNEKCRASVFEYEGLWRRMTKEMAYAIDLDNPYITLDNNYVETCWWIMKQFYDAGLMYEGHKILPFCTRCGTGLASHEVAQGYQMITVDTVYVRFKRKDANEYFLVWTTTPWTLAANVALTVGADIDYLKVQDAAGDVYYIAEVLAPKVMKTEYTVLEKLKGKDLEYIEYEQLMPFVQTDKKAFYVTCADYVTTEDGTGIVHTAPAFGEDDYNTGVRYDLPVLNPVGEDGKYTTTPWKGTFVMDADPEVIKYLIEHGILYRKQKFEHNYPFCWRCKTPLLYYAKPSWYISMSKLRDQLTANNNTVSWFPSFVGEKRFGNWLENAKDWAISRSRYWGTPLPIWKCSCGHIHCIGSRKELVEMAVENIDESIELHRPYVDDVHLRCPECGGEMKRVTDVVDCWFDSGAMPYAQWHYPFEHKDDFDTLFPADFICEGIDQTRGWFYSLLCISTFIKGRAPYKSVLVNDLILDKYGLKMSKSRGNTVDPFELFEKYSADAVRWYLLYVSPPWLPTRFNEDGLGEVISKFFSTFRNVYNLFATYANTDNMDPRTFCIPVAERPELDRWILSKFNSLVKSVNEDWNNMDMNQSVRAIQNFVNEELSNWYIRRSRRRFWASGESDDKKAVYNTTYEVLTGLARLVAPYVPYISDDIYTRLTDEESVHLVSYPQSDESLINKHIEERMDLVRTIAAVGRSSREDVHIKVRQPISKVILDAESKELIEDLVPLIQEELNSKTVEFRSDIGEMVTYTVKPNYKVAGKLLGKNMKAFAAAVAAANPVELKEKLVDGFEMEIGGEKYQITSEMVQVNMEAREGYSAEVGGGVLVILDTQLTPELLAEGYARELVSKVQQERKNRDFNVVDHIEMTYKADEVLAAAFKQFADYICTETLCDDFTEVTEAGEGFDAFKLNDRDAFIRIIRK